MAFKILKYGKKTKTKLEYKFIGRNKESEIFWDNYKYLTQHENVDESKILSFYGMTSGGKTSFCNNLIEQIQEKNKKLSQKKQIRYIYHDFKEENDFRQSLQIMCDKLKEKYNFFFPMFDYSWYAYKSRLGLAANSDEMNGYVNNSKILRYMVKIMGSVPVDGAYATFTKYAVKGNPVLRKFIAKHQTEVKAIENAKLSSLESMLVAFFARDLWNNVSVYRDPFVVFFDSYEHLTGELSQIVDPINNDLWLRGVEEGQEGLMLRLPNTLWVVLGRESLRWHEMDDMWDDSALEQHELENLCLEETVEYLNYKDVNEREICEGMYKLTGGKIVDLDSCVKKYEELTEMFDEPNIDNFTNDYKAIADDMLKYVDDEIKQILYLCASIGEWDDDSINQIATKKNVYINEVQYNKVISSSYVEIVRQTKKGNVYRLRNDIYSILSSIEENEKHNGVADDELKKGVTETIAEQNNDAAIEDVNDQVINYINDNVSVDGENSNEESVLDANSDNDFSEELLDDFDLNSELDNELDSDNDNKLDNELDNELEEMDIELTGEFEEEYGELDNEDNNEELLASSGSDDGENIDDDLNVSEQVFVDNDICERYENEKEKLITFINEYNFTSFDDEFNVLWEAVSNSPDMTEYLLFLGIKLMYMVNKSDYYVVNQIIDEIESKKEEANISNKYLAELDYALARGYYYLEDYNKSCELDNSAMEIRNSIYGDISDETLSSMVSLGNDYLKLGDNDKAFAYINDAYEKRKQSYGMESIGTLIAYGCLADAYCVLGENEKAFDISRDLYDRSKKFFGKENPNTTTALRKIGRIYSELQMYQEALNIARKIKNTFEAVLGTSHHITLESYDELAYICEVLGINNEALDIRKKIYDGSVVLYGEANKKTIIANFNYLRVCLLSNKAKDVVSISVEEYDMCSNLYGQENEYSVMMLRMFGDAVVASGMEKKVNKDTKLKSMFEKYLALDGENSEIENEDNFASEKLEELESNEESLEEIPELDETMTISFEESKKSDAKSYSDMDNYSGMSRRKSMSYSKNTENSLDDEMYESTTKEDEDDEFAKLFAQVDKAIQNETIKNVAMMDFANSNEGEEKDNEEDDEDFAQFDGGIEVDTSYFGSSGYTKADDWEK